MPPQNVPVPDPSALTTEALEKEIKHLDDKIMARFNMIDERFIAMKILFDEVQVRHAQRFEAQTKALDAAFLASQTAVSAALLAADKGIQAAMAASEKAVTKAEAFSEKRFDALLEFQRSLDMIKGKSSGLNLSWVLLLGVVSIIGTLIAVLK